MPGGGGRGRAAPVGARSLPPARPRSGTSALARDAELFFALSSALPLSAGEERALLSLPAGRIAALRAGPAAEIQLDWGKLERRLAYAIPILQRMIAAIAA